MRPVHVLLPALALAFGPGAALAQTPPSASGAQALEAQAAAALGSVLHWAKLGARPVQLKAEGDHYLVRIPLAPLGVPRVEPEDAAFTAKATPLGGTLWSLADQKLPPEFTFTARQNVADPPDAQDPSPSRHSETVAYTIKLGQQDTSGTFDTALASPTSTSSAIASLDILRDGGSGVSATHFGRLATLASTEPVDPAHVNLLADSTAQDYASQSDLPDGTQFSLTASRVHTVTSLSGLAHAALVPVLQQISKLSLEARANQARPQGPTPAEWATLRTMLQDAHGLLTGARLDQAAEGLKFDFGGHAGSADKLAVSLGGTAPQALLVADMTFELDGLALDGLPPQLAAYVPSHFAIHPTVSNLSVAALTKAALDATEPATPGPDGTVPDRISPDLQALFAQGGIDFGFDSLVLQVAGARLSGTGKFVLTSPDTVTGQAELAADGLDDLLARTQADPLLQPAAPVIIFLKGIAKTTGSQAAWLVTVDRGRLLVNGVDLSAIIGNQR